MYVWPCRSMKLRNENQKRDTDNLAHFQFGWLRPWVKRSSRKFRKKVTVKIENNENEIIFIGFIGL